MHAQTRVPLATPAHEPLCLTQGVVILHCLPSLLFAGVVTRFTLERASLLHSIGSLTSAQRVASALILPKDRPQASKAQHERALVLTE